MKLYYCSVARTVAQWSPTGKSCLIIPDAGPSSPGVQGLGPSSNQADEEFPMQE